MTALVAAGVTLAALGCALLAWRWWLASMTGERGAQRAHELEIHRHHVEVDTKALEADRAKLRNLEERVKALEYRPSR